MITRGMGFVAATLLLIQPVVSEPVWAQNTAWRPVVMGTNGMVASGHPLASMAGTETLMNGGNAVDAAIAAWAVQGLVEPGMRTR